MNSPSSMTQSKIDFLQELQLKCCRMRLLRNPFNKSVPIFLCEAMPESAIDSSDVFSARVDGFWYDQAGVGEKKHKKSRIRGPRWCQDTVKLLLEGKLLESLSTNKNWTRLWIQNPKFCKIKPKDVILRFHRKPELSITNSFASQFEVSSQGFVLSHGSWTNPKSA